jgi:hypothetical protein
MCVSSGKFGRAIDLFTFVVSGIIGQIGLQSVNGFFQLVGIRWTRDEVSVRRRVV